MATNAKDTIYVDIDDEITGVIDKVQNSSGKLVALVLPKRATVFQSIVNMKLLKRAADSKSKNIVLITAEAGLLPLAGAAGIHVAKTLSSKPEVPLGPDSIIDTNEAVDEDAPIITGADEPEKEIDPATPVGKLDPKADGVETLTLDNDELPEDAAAATAADEADKKKPKKNKKLKVPNFNRFRLILGIFVLIMIILIVLFLLLNASLKKATIDISTNATNVPVSLSLNLSTAADAVNSNNGTLPAKYVSQQKTFTQEVTTTGQKNEGNKAAGTITVSVSGQCGVFSSAPASIPAGTGASANGQTYIIEDEIVFQNGTISKGDCQYQGEDASNPNNGNNIPIIAQTGGSAYNVSGVTFTIDDSSDTATGSASGGTDDIVQTVNQNDIDNAKDKISTGSTTSLKSGLDTELKGDGYYPIDSTFSSGTPAVTSSAQVGEAANSVSVTEVVTYSMFGVYKNDLTKLVGDSVSNQINTSRQSILDYGIDTASYSVNSQSPSSAQLTMTTNAIAGPHLNIANVKSLAAGKKAGDIKTALMLDPNVTNVKVSFSPFWVNSAPKSASKITVNIAKPAK